MKVLMTADAVGGVWTYALDLARGLAREGVGTVLAAMGPGLDDAKHSEAATVPGLALVETGLPLDWLAEDPATVAEAGRQVADLARVHSVDLVHLNSPALAADAAFPRPVVGLCHSCVATWWAAMRDGPLPDDFRWRTDLVRRGYAACDALIAPSRAFANATVRAYGLSTAPIVVHNGRGQAPYLSPRGRDRVGASRPGEGEAPSPDRSQPPHPTLSPSGRGFPASSWAPQCAPFVFTAGRLWDEGKAIATLDRVAARLDIPVRAAGPTRGPNGTEIRLDAIEALGSLAPDAVADAMARRPIFVSLARYEPFGLAVLEAAQAGCALVLSDIATFRELWDSAATFVAPDDEAGATDAIRRLAADYAERAERGEAARSRAARYTVDAMTAGTLGVYRRVLAERTAAAA